MSYDTDRSEIDRGRRWGRFLCAKHLVHMSGTAGSERNTGSALPSRHWLDLPNRVYSTLQGSAWPRRSGRPMTISGRHISSTSG